MTPRSLADPLPETLQSPPGKSGKTLEPQTLHPVSPAFSNKPANFSNMVGPPDLALRAGPARAPGASVSLQGYQLRLFGKQAFVVQAVTTSAKATLKKQKASSLTQPKLAPTWSRRVHLYRSGGIQPRLHLGKIGGLKPDPNPNLARLEGLQARLNLNKRKNLRARPSPNLAPACSKQVQKTNRQERDQSSREP